MKNPILSALILLISLAAANAAPRTIQVFVALCDNESQGIAPVPARIGDGNKPDANLYWGCSDGLASFFKQSSRWKLVKTEKEVTADILVRLQFKHASADLQLTASAYRGTAIESCVKDFEATLAKGEDALVAYIGHNGLMDFKLAPPARGSDKRPAAVVLCCLSESYFKERIVSAGGKAILLTDQFMYPGSFLLHDAVEAWRQGKPLADIRAAAGRAYARNQKIPVKAATGVFAKLRRKSQVTRSLLTALLIGLLSCGQAQEKEGPDAPANEIVDAARSQVGKTTIYDGSYVKLGYPGGDIALERGVCTDVIIRALRTANSMDLQKLVHEDMVANFSKYPKIWGLQRTDRNIDHRRVPNLKTYFKRRGYAVPVTKKKADYLPGDLVTCTVPPNLPHIMVVSNRKNARGVPLVIHNIGRGAQEEDTLFTYPLTGHYRLKAD